MIESFSGLAIAFMIIASILVYLLINSKMHIILKVILITLAIWYSLILWHTPPKFMGWPAPVSEIPEQSRILCYIVDEPKPNNPGGIYLWTIVQDTSKPTLIDQLDPSTAFGFKYTSAPRQYIIPYDRSFHKLLIQMSMGLAPGQFIELVWDKEEIEGQDMSVKLKLKLRNPVIGISKETGEEIRNR